MELNFGIINYRKKKKIRNILLEGDFSETKNVVNKYTSIIQESYPLHVIYKTFKSIENKYVPLHTEKYLDKILESVATIDYDEYLKDIQALSVYNEADINVPDTLKKLYENINVLVIEHMKPVVKKDTKKIFDSYIYITEHLKNDKKGDSFSKITYEDQDYIKFLKENYASKDAGIEESDIEILYLIEKGSVDDLNQKFSSIKEDILIKLIQENEISPEYKSKAIEKIKGMNNNQIKSNIVNLHLLNKSL